ncbi:recombination mediator RecR [Sandaracinobacteroides sp. A072]|uniref:recombination mediator RecR n=1 Tax=Sandaracinobacteroides sp. A072 TaxID=3461146 RepID=UPI0040423E86
MDKSRVDDALANLTALIARLPGLGPRSARRVLLYLMKNRETMLKPLLAALQKVDSSLVSCVVCGNLDTTTPCRICTDQKRDPALLCVVADVSDLWALERGRLFPGRYHVLGGTLSAFDGVGPEELGIDRLLARLPGPPPVEEVVLAMNATLEGQTTAHVIAEQLEGRGVKVTQLAHGVPVGGELDYLDEGTLAQALRLRRPLG